MRISRRLAVFLCAGLPASLVLAAAAAVGLDWRQSQLDQALISAIRNGKPAVALAVLQAGASPNAMDDGPPRGLHEAMLDVWYRLRGVHVRREVGLSALYMAVHANEVDTANAMLDRGAVPRDEVDGEERSIVYWALDRSRDALALRLGARGAGSADEKRILLSMAVEKNDRDLVLKLVAAGANIRGDREPHGSPFFTAVLAGNWPMMQFLLAHGANVNDSGSDEGFDADISALCLAAHRNDLRLATFLLAHGADANAAGKYSCPLVAAARREHIGMVRLLLKHGADPNISGYFGSALSAVYDLEDDNRDENPDWRDISEASRSRREEILRLLLTARAHPNEEGNSGSSLLATAAWYGDNRGIKALLEHGADVNLRSWHDGSTALTDAAEQGHFASVRLLLSRGANVNVTVAQIDPNASDPSKYISGHRTALDLATENGHTRVARLLRRWGGKRASELGSPLAHADEAD